LHVAGAAAVEAAVGLAQRERVARPVLAVDRNDVAVPGQDHTRPVRRADRRPQIGLGTVLVPDRVAGDAMARQIVFDIGDQVTVRIARDGWEGHEIADHRHAFVAAGRSARAQCADFRLGVATIDMASSPLWRPRGASRPVYGPWRGSASAWPTVGGSVAGRAAIRGRQGGPLVLAAFPAGRDLSQALPPSSWYLRPHRRRR